MRSFLPNSQTRALAMAIAGAALAAVTTMFLPVALLEGVAGSSGLSELIPAARAPLGDTARALIAFAAGATTLAVLSYLLLRSEGTVPRAIPRDERVWDAFAHKGGNLAKAILTKMPWHKDADDIRELGDLPRLRMGDVHPDAPARRPLFASQDLPTLELSQEHLAAPQTLQVTEHLVDAAEEVVEPEAIVLAPEPEPVTPVNPAPSDSSSVADLQPSIADMVAQLETAVALRRQKLAELEAVAADLSADANNADEPSPVTVEQAVMPVIEPVAPSAEFRPMRRPVLEAVPTVAVQDDDMDSALAAALATLHRINAGAR